MRENNKEVNLIKIYFKHIYKCHNNPLMLQLLYATFLKSKGKNKRFKSQQASMGSFLMEQR
jgi:hypothetical protein